MVHVIIYLLPERHMGSDIRRSDENFHKNLEKPSIIHKNLTLRETMVYTEHFCSWVPAVWVDL